MEKESPAMVKSHEGRVVLSNAFDAVYDWLNENGSLWLTTETGTSFEARADVTRRGPHSGERVIRFFQHSDEYARAYECCWGHYHNCNRTRIGMYCVALDVAVS